MDIQIKLKLDLEYNIRIGKIEEWENFNKDTIIFKFYESILKYKFYTPIDSLTIESLIRTSLYLFLSKVVSFYSDIDFIETLQSFLSNCSDDFFFKIIFDKGSPIIYMDSDGSQDISILIETLNSIIEKETQYYNKIMSIKNKLKHNN